jgi:hypothetical protein
VHSPLNKTIMESSAGRYTALNGATTVLDFPLNIGLLCAQCKPGEKFKDGKCKPKVCLRLDQGLGAIQ